MQKGAPEKRRHQKTIYIVSAEKEGTKPRGQVRPVFCARGLGRGATLQERLLSPLFALEGPGKGERMNRNHTDFLHKAEK
jgi:hypothetical protein